MDENLNEHTYKLCSQTTTIRLVVSWLTVAYAVQVPSQCLNKLGYCRHRKPIRFLSRLLKGLDSCECQTLRLLLEEQRTHKLLGLRIFSFQKHTGHIQHTIKLQVHAAISDNRTNSPPPVMSQRF